MPINLDFQKKQITNKVDPEKKVKVENFSDLQTKVQAAGQADKRIAGQFNDLSKKDSSAPVNAFLQENGVTLDQVWKLMGVQNVGMETVQSLYSNDYLKPFFNAQVEQGFRSGYEQGGRVNELIATTINMDQMSYQYYYDDSFNKVADTSTQSELGYNLVEQGGPIPVVQIKAMHDRTIAVTKRGKGIEWTDEAKSMNMDLLAMHARKQGLILSRQDQARAIHMLRNGYFSDGFDAPITEAAKDASAFIPSIWYAVKRFEDQTGMTVNRLIMNENRFFEYMTSLDGQGNYLFLQQLLGGQDEANIRIQSAAPFIDNTLADNEVMLVDTNNALARYSFKPLSTETERFVNRQVEGSYTTITDDYIPFDPLARRIITF
jgi:hypothetical protein